MTVDKRKLHTESNRGASAQALPDNPLFVDAFQSINRAIWAQLGKVSVHDHETIGALLALRKADEKLYEVFAQHVKTGQMADMQLREMNARGE